MTTAWSARELEQICSAKELQIATKRADGTLAALGADMGCLRR